MSQTQMPLGRHSCFSAQLPQLPPQPSSPQSLPSQLGAQVVHRPAAQYGVLGRVWQSV